MFDWRKALNGGLVIPAHPLALTAERKLDERRQRALSRYYLDAGAGGLAVGVHTTQFQIRDPKVGLFREVLSLAAGAMDGLDVVRVAGICGPTHQAVQEAQTARSLGYHAGLLSLAALAQAPVAELVEHARAVGEVMPLIGFYLQPAVGGRRLPREFWREFAALPSVVAIKIAPFHRYQTLDVLRGVAESGRASEIALYTGNDDHIVLDLLSHWTLDGHELHFAGGLLGHWSVWALRAVELLARIQALRAAGGAAGPEWFELAEQTTEANAALFDATNSFAGCIAGLHEILRRQGLLEGTWCLDPEEGLSPGQSEELDRICRLYPHLTDDEFVARNRDKWLN
ncbi:dihydrodipicolinate synthase family protein [Paludibaculum fermentans]|uniref:Dihydrodipicolinate synthase family protein n=1 Tax=Paludibaculum fermentans TaxID=1473598 RepID=A0A7S7NWV0_PALFE|nr:dihydrodipicolinate synthase family protein [Paludibaculum fermentans]QOY91262.1 dihydrodipicolinate synthase family protein [Paludibaculum fermentans]